MNLPFLQPKFPCSCENADRTVSTDNTKATITFLIFDIVENLSLVNLSFVALHRVALGLVFSVALFNIFMLIATDNLRQHGSVVLCRGPLRVDGLFQPCYSSRGVAIYAWNIPDTTKKPPT